MRRNEDKRMRGPGAVEVKPLLGFLHRAHGTAAVVKPVGPMGSDGYYCPDGLEGYWQPMAHRRAYGFSEEQALKRCKKKLCDAVTHDKQLCDEAEEKARLKEERTQRFENPCEVDPNVTKDTRT